MRGQILGVAGYYFFSRMRFITSLTMGSTCVEAFYELVRPYERAVFLAALSLVKNDADAEEVSQETILKAFKNLSRFRQEAKFGSWLIQISIKEARRRWRKDGANRYR